MRKWPGLVCLLCIIWHGGRASADPAADAAVPAELASHVKAATHSMAVRVAGGKLTTLAGTSLELKRPNGASTRVHAAVPELAGAEPLTLIFDDEWRYKLVLRVAPAQLLTVARVPVLLAAAPNAIGGDFASLTPGIRIRRGAPLKVVDRRGAAAKVEVANERLDPITGWISAEAIGTSFVPSEKEDWLATDRLFRGPMVVIPTHLSLLKAPRGKELLKLSALLPREDTYGNEVSRKAGSVLVRVSGLHWYALGWVAPADEVETEEGEEGGVAGGWLPGGIELARGTPLLTKPGGEVIGWVTSTHRATLEETTKTAHRLRLFLASGQLDVWVAGPLPLLKGDGDDLFASAPPPPPPPPPPAIVPPKDLEKLRLAGAATILPDPVTQTEIMRSGKDRLVTVFKLCITDAGAISQLERKKSSGFPAYDATLERVMRSTWRYAPFLIDGVAKPVCTMITFTTRTKDFAPASGNPH